jgi:hypothetical protein
MSGRESTRPAGHADRRSTSTAGIESTIGATTTADA